VGICTWIFHGEKETQIQQKKFANQIDFYDKFQHLTKNITKCLYNGRRRKNDLNFFCKSNRGVLAHCAKQK
jgi:hypothetical protein